MSCSTCSLLQLLYAFSCFNNSVISVRWGFLFIFNWSGCNSTQFSTIKCVSPAVPNRLKCSKLKDWDVGHFTEQAMCNKHITHRFNQSTIQSLFWSLDVSALSSTWTSSTTTCWCCWMQLVVFVCGVKLHLVPGHSFYVVKFLLKVINSKILRLSVRIIKMLRHYFSSFRCFWFSLKLFNNLLLNYFCPLPPWISSSTLSGAILHSQ